jgi:hypothetical protein
MRAKVRTVLGFCMLLYALTVFTGAFLLFQVQPLIGKFILPWFGGSPGVWTACLLFFQTLLLGGYAYAHVLTSRVKPTRQAVIHIALLVVSLLFLPIIPSEVWRPGPAEDPTGRILLLLAATIGLPYFVLSTTGPLLQRWFSQTHAGVSPYRLYALSNVGSLLALLSYPFVVEPALSRHAQAWGWSAGLLFFVVVCGLCAWRLRRQAALQGDFAEQQAREEGLAVRPTPTDQALWLGLPAVASILLLAVTNKVSQDVAVIPFLWVLPLALYLLTFILCFDHPRWYRRGLFAALTTLGIGVSTYLLHQGNAAGLNQQVVGYMALLFCACMLCHGELYRLKPAPVFLTRYFLCIAAGGAMGGLFVALVAPHIFSQYFELHVGMWLLAYLMGVIALVYRARPLVFAPMVGLLLVALVVPAMEVRFPDDWGHFFRLWWREVQVFYLNYRKEILGLLLIFALCVGHWRTGWVKEWKPRLAGFTMLLAVGLGVVLVLQAVQKDSAALAGGRNFYGTLHVFEYNPDEPRAHYYLLRHGGTTHGLQFRVMPQATWPTSYYARSSGVGLAVDHLPTGPRRIGVVGLGTGSMAAYGREGDVIRFYDINPAVDRIARTHFTYLEQSAAEVEVLLGDARLVMEDELEAGQPQNYDLLALDAFSSDAIPVHLLTREALALYLQHLAPGGVIAVHISNRYIDLRPVVQLLADDAGLHMAMIQDDPSEEWWLYRTSWILLSADPEFLAQEAIADVTDDPKPVGPRVSLWTDDYASLFPILK